VGAEIPPAEAQELRPEALPLEVVYEDDAVLVVNKPAGMVVHPGAGQAGGTLAAAVLAHAPETARVGGQRRPGIVHRLDKGTSGLLVVAKTRPAYDSLVAQLAARTVARRYLVVVHGLPTPSDGVIDAPIGRHPRDRVRMAVRPPGQGKRAVTRYRVLERFPVVPAAYLEARLETGRTHQIRVHLAAGEGKRMRSRHPKVLHRLCGRPLLGYPLRLARALGDRIVVVVGREAAEVRAAAGPGVEFAEQAERLGTGHAVQQARAACGDGAIVVLPGDTPLLSEATVTRLIDHHAKTGAAVTLLTALVERPAGYGRVLRQRGHVRGVVEDRDATDDQRRIREINTSVYCFDARRLWPALAKVTASNEQGEFYLTDVVGILARAGARVEAVTTPDPAECLGVN